MIAAADLISAALRGARGCKATLGATRECADVETGSVDILIDAKDMEPATSGWETMGG